MSDLSNLIIFDLDGVITSEEAYWDAAGMTLHELLYSPRYLGLGAPSSSEGENQSAYRPALTPEENRRVSRATYPEAEIQAFKARAVNSNWDTCYAAVCLHFIHLLALLPDCSPLLPFQPWDMAWIAAFSKTIATLQADLDAPEAEKNDILLRDAFHFKIPMCDNCVGLDLINCFDGYASALLSHPVNNAFSRYSPFWSFSRDIFQEWYLGDDLYHQTYGHAPRQPGKPGCIYFERPLLPVEHVQTALETLRRQGYMLGFATGRLRQEALYPLQSHGLLTCFAEQHCSTYDDVEQAEAQLRAIGNQTLLSKPHPFAFLYAAEPGAIDALLHEETRDNARGFVVVGDSTSDILGGRAAGAITVAVLTGARSPAARRLLVESEPDFIIDDVTNLPPLLAHIDSLATIQRLQFSELAQAERLLQRWFARHMRIAAQSVTLSPKATSLNSFNGFYRDKGEEFFFKTHVEEQSALQEFYHAELLDKAGYKVVKPLRTLHEQGQQMVVYPVLHWPVMFDLLCEAEAGNVEDERLETIIAAERCECARLLSIYRSTLERSAAEQHALAPIHQLFWHRLAGGRLASFYEGKTVPLPGAAVEPSGGLMRDRDIPFNELLHYQWVINSSVQPGTLGELLEQARRTLHPARAGATIIGHGDAHFGNVFLERQTDYLYFDPAFAGRHSPLLDIVKPLFHNIFATWMYFPIEVASGLRLSVQVDGTRLLVDHTFTLTPARRALLATKVSCLLKPLVAWLEAEKFLPADWQELLRLALLCCPLLTINLLDRERVPPVISWLGLAFAVQMGNNGIEPWRAKL